MKITFEIITFLLRDKIVKEKISHSDGSINGARLWNPKGSFRDDLLYLTDFETLNCVCEEGKLSKEILPRSFIIFLYPDMKNSRGVLRLWDLLGQMGKDSSLALAEDELKADRDLDYIEDLFYGLDRWDSSFDRLILKQEDYSRVFEKGREFLPWEYALFDRDLDLLYESNKNSGPSSSFTREILQDLILHKSFHDAAKKKGAFYYDEDYTGLKNLCCNFFIKGEYAARLVMVLNEKEETVPPGAFEIFNVFCAHIQDVFDYGNFAMGRRSNDEMHKLLASAAKGEEFPADLPKAALEDYGWKNGQVYTAIVLRFYTEEGWDSQLESTLPFLAVELEREFENSCAAVSGKEIVMLINQNAPDLKYDKQKFLQEIAGFVRDNVCKAGISPDFEDLAEVSFAVSAARAALALGESLEPYSWYYSFETFRLEYLLSQCARELPLSMLRHPALKILEKYDKENNSELSLTLKAYLEHNLNMSAAAQKLYIHRTTFCRRMEKIKELTGLDLEDSDVILELSLSYRLKKD